MPTEILEGDGRDIASIMPIMDAAFDPQFGEAWTAAQCLSLLATPGTSLLLARADNSIVGFALTRWIIDEEELLMIGVNPKMQRSGIATDLITHLIRRAKAFKRERIFLEVRANNSALQFYKLMGFQACGTRKNYYKGANGSRFDATTMNLNL